MPSSNLASRPISAAKVAWAFPVAAVAPSFGNLAVYAIAKGFLGVDFIFPLQPQAAPEALPIVNLVLANVVPAAVASVLLVLLARFTKNGVTWFWLISLVVMFGSLIGPMKLEETTDATKWALGLMHVVAGFLIPVVLTRLGRADSARRIAAAAAAALH